MGLGAINKISSLILASIFSFFIILALYLDRKQTINGMLVCSQPSGEAAIPFDYAQRYIEALTQFEKSLSNLDSINGAIAKSVLFPASTNYQSATDELLTITQNEPQSQFAAVQLLKACIEQIEHPSCGVSVIDHAISLEEQNASTWSLISGLRYRQGDDYGALVALESAVQAPIYNDYFQTGLEISMGAKAVIDADIVQPIQSSMITYAVELSTNKYSSLQPVFELCSSKLIENQRLSEACLNFGERVEREASSLLGSGLGIALQTTAYQGMGETAEAQRMEIEYRLKQQEFIESDGFVAMQLLANDPELYSFWIDQLVNSGEYIAIELIAEEVKQLSHQWDYNPCPSAVFGNLLFKAKDFSRWVLHG